MKAYLIDTANRTINLVDYSGHYTHIYELCGFDTFDVVNLTEDDDSLYVDDNGLIQGPVTQFFGFLGYAQPLAGNGLILGTNQDGDSVEPKNPLDFFKQRLCWIERLDRHRWSVQKANSRGAALMSLGDVEKLLSKAL